MYVILKKKITLVLLFRYSQKIFPQNISLGDALLKITQDQRFVILCAYSDLHSINYHATSTVSLVYDTQTVHIPEVHVSSQ